MSLEPLASLAKDRGRARVAKRAARTSDQTRPRHMAIGALVAGVTALAALAATPGEARAPGPLARPHVEAKLACGACHGRAGAATAREACTSCHGATSHVSTRAAHRALAASGRLGCTTCHPAHGAAEGVTFASDGHFVWWRGDREIGGALPAAIARATVPLIDAAACARCHDRADPRDPIAACLVAKAPFATCFDEHQRADDPPRAPPAIACARQHTASRFVAWDLTSRIVAGGEPDARGASIAPRESTTPPRPAAPRAPASRAPWSVLAALLACAASFAVLARRRSHRPIPDAPLAPPTRARLPRIDPSTCLGCYACVDACPFDVLAIQRYVAIVARPADCCGVILCAQACPNDSLRIDEGATKAERLRLDAHLESLDAPGVFVAGNLSGLPLIKNAIHQGARVVDRIASLPRGRARAGDADLVVVGAGPAGISAMLRAKERGLRAICLEQGALAASIRSFPRKKIVYDPPLDLPVEGALWLREATKEVLVAQWSRIVRTHALDIREDRRVTAIAPDSGGYVVTSADRNGARAPLALRTARVLLAIGKRGTPRTLPVALSPDVEAKVSYAVADARSFAGMHVLIVGLGDAAMEAAIAIARQPDTTVTVSYRGADFARGKARNIAELRALVAAGKVRIAFGSRLDRVELASVTLCIDEKREEIPNDAVVVLIGGAPSWDLVHAAGVRFEKPASGLVPVENLSRRRP